MPPLAVKYPLGYVTYLTSLKERKKNVPMSTPLGKPKRVEMKIEVGYLTYAEVSL